MSILDKIGKSGSRNNTEKAFAERSKKLSILVEKLEDERIRDYIQNRVITQVNYFDIRSGQCKRDYNLCMTVSIILGALIPIVSVFSDGAVGFRVLTAFLGSSVTAINAFLALHNSKDLWLAYRGACEELVSILYCYLNDAGDFTGCTLEQKNAKLIQICEAELSREAVEWRTKWRETNPTGGKT